MPTVGDIQALTDPYRGTFTPVPPIGAGVCDVCHGAPNPGWSRCWSCAQTISQVSRPLTRILPVTLAASMGPMHYLLRKYKDGPAELQQRLRPRVAALLARFLQHHRRCIGDWDTITVVPSGVGRPGPHPLLQTIGMAPALASASAELLHASARPARHLAASDEAFTVSAEVHDRRVLLVDDMLTSGAELQSAASALQAAGAIIPAAVVLGRYLNPDFSQAAADLWGRARARSFTFDRCCRCDEPWN
jgi:predicted amidophosphoribosyltransferase